MYLETNYYKENTGLPMAILVGPKGLNIHGGPRIKMQRDYIQKMNAANLCSIAISDNPKIIAGDQGKIINAHLEMVYAWVKLNKQSLLKLWRGEYRSFKDFEKDIIKM
jgi:hypothetical protein